MVRLDRRVSGRTVEGSGSTCVVTCEPGAAGRIAGRIVGLPGDPGIPGNPGILGQSRDIGPTPPLERSRYYDV